MKNSFLMIKISQTNILLNFSMIYKKNIYLDYAATTPVDTRVVAKMNECLTFDGLFGNPSSQHEYGYRALQKVEWAREQLAQVISAKTHEIIWTSGATEAINLALKGASQIYGRQRRHLITMQTEHQATLSTCRFLQKEGLSVSYLKPTPTGLIDWEQLEKFYQPDTFMLSIAHVNNETGVIQDIEKIAKWCKEKNILCHIDGAQSLGKITVDLQNAPVDFMSFSAHKCYGPKGIGALFMKEGLRLKPQLLGGEQEQNTRAGTLPTHQIVGFGAACHLLLLNVGQEQQRIKDLRNLLWNHIEKLPGIILNNDFSISTPNHLNISICGVEGESLLYALNRDLAVSSGSACKGAAVEPSHVLLAMGIQPEIAHSSVRFSLGRYTTQEDIERAASIIHRCVNHLRILAGAK